MLDHPELNIRFVARNSLSIDMKKRGVLKVNSSEISNFLGYKCKDNGLIETNIKGGFGVSSDWPHLNQLTRKMDITLVFEQCPAENLLEAGKVCVVLPGCDVFNGSIKALRRRLIFQQLDRELVEFKQLKMQGTLIDLRNVDYLKSQDIFRNVKFADKLVVFWYKMRHNVLGCNYTLSIWYGSPPQYPLDEGRGGGGE